MKTKIVTSGKPAPPVISKGAKVVQLFKGAKSRMDGWINTLTGIGIVGRDKLVGGDFERKPRLTDEFLAALYDGDDLAARIVDMVPETALAKGWSVKVETDDATDDSVLQAAELGADVVRELESMMATDRLVEAWAWGRLYGGGALYLVTDDGELDQAEPLELESLRKLESLIVMDKRELTPHDYYTDPTDPKFGQPSSYRIQKMGASGSTGTAVAVIPVVHETRLIIFGGVRTTIREKQTNQGWDLSILQRVYDVLRQFNLSWSALANMLQSASQGVFEMEGLIEMIAAGEEQTLATRMGLVDVQRSVSRSLVIDAENESFTQVATNFAGVPDSLRVFMLRISAAARAPLTVLMGMSPAGQNATGESDLRLFAGMVATDRNRILTPRLGRLVEIVLASSEGPAGGQVPERWAIDYPEILEMTEPEAAALRKTVAETDAIYLANQVLLPEEVAINRFGSSGWSSDTVIDTADREELLQNEEPEPDAEPTEPEPEPDAEPEPEPDEGPEPNPQATQAAGAIVGKFIAGEIPEATAMELLTFGLAMPADVARRMLGPIDESFENPDPEAEPEISPTPALPAPPGAPASEPDVEPGEEPEPSGEPTAELEGVDLDEPEEPEDGEELEHDHCTGEEHEPHG